MTSDVCLQARDWIWIGNTWSRQPMDNLEISQQMTGYNCSKEQRKKWGYFNEDTTCACGMPIENTPHMLRCSLLSHHCTLDDLKEMNVPSNRREKFDDTMMIMTSIRLLYFRVPFIIKHSRQPSDHSPPPPPPTKECFLRL